MALTAQQVQQFYIGYYGRPADPVGLTFWQTQTEAQALAGFGGSAEFTNQFTGLSVSQQVTKVYGNLLGRTPDAAGLLYWSGEITAGRETIGSLVLSMTKNALGKDVTTIADRVTYSTAFTAALDTTAEINAYAGVAATQAARDALLKVISASVGDHTALTAETAKIDATIAAIVSGGTSNPGQTFTLTDGIDIVNGTSGNDTIIAGTKAAAATLTGGDQIDGGAGTDTIKLYGQVNTANFSGANIKNVEVVDAYFDNVASTLNVAANSGVTTVNVGDSTVTNAAGTGQITVTAAKAQAVGITGTILNDTTTSAAGNNANVTFAFSDVTGGADTATLNVNNAKFAKNAANVLGAGSGVTIAGVETLNIAATGTNALGNLLAAQTTKLVITGAGSLSATLSQAAGLTKTIDGSAATGSLTINNAAAAAAVESIKTGSGNDVYTTVFANLTKDDVIDLGTGTDSLRFTDAVTINSAATAAGLTKVTGVEQLGTVGTALTVDGDFVSQTSYLTSGVGSVVLTNIANNAAVTLATGVTAASSVAMKLGSNTLNVNVAGSALGAADVTAGLTVTGSATLNVNSSGVDGIANNVLGLTAADNQAVVVTGSQNLTLTAANAGGVTGFSIDGSAFTGKLTVTGTGSSDIVKGGSGADTISGGAGAVADTLTGGAGADKFIIIAGITAATADVVTDFVTKSDTIDFSAGTAVAATSANYAEGAAPVADFAAALIAANAALNGTVKYSVQQVGSDSWVFFGNVAATATEVVKLTGVALTGVEFADIV